MRNRVWNLLDILMNEDQADLAKRPLFVVVVAFVVVIIVFHSDIIFDIVAVVHFHNCFPYSICGSIFSHLKCKQPGVTPDGCELA